MSDMEITSPTPRRVAMPRWLDLRLVLGVALVLAAVLIGATVLARARHTDKELAVTRDLAAGSTVRAADLRLVDTQLPADVRRDGGYLSDAADVVGKVVARPLHKGELVTASALGVATSATTVSVPFAADAAPSLARGQRIVVWLSTPACPSIVLLPDVAVQDVRAADAGSFSSGGTGQDVVLSVAPELAQRVVQALAIQDATIRAGVLTGPSPVTKAALPALGPCTVPAS